MLQQPNEHLLSANGKTVYVYTLPPNASQAEITEACESLAQSFDNVVVVPNGAILNQLGGCRWEEKFEERSICWQAPTVADLLRLRQVYLDEVEASEREYVEQNERIRKAREADQPVIREQK